MNTYTGASQIVVETSLTDDFKHFSVGNPFVMAPNLEFNRIHADLEIIKGRKGKVIELELVGEQQGIRKFGALMRRSDCGQVFFDKLPAGGTKLTRRSMHRLGHTFSVPFNETFGVIANGVDPLDLYVKATLSDGRVVKSNVRQVLPLISIPLTRTQIFGTVDDYSSVKANTLRTGGDKWIRPFYSSIASSFVSAPGGWKINDMSKANGGKFEPHDGHEAGTDIDVSNFNLRTSVDTSVINGIEDFILRYNYLFTQIESIFITLAEGSFDRKWVQSRFDFRCIGENPKRFVDLTIPLTFGKSLMRSIAKHHDHLHYSFNKPLNGPLPAELPVTAPTKVSLNDVKFKLLANGLLDVSPIDGRDFSGVRILWRYQIRPDFINPDSWVQYGRWPFYEGPESIDPTGSIPENSSSIRYIHLTFADTKSGGCTTEMLTIDLSKSMEEWRYVDGKRIAF